MRKRLSERELALRKLRYAVVAAFNAGADDHQVKDTVDRVRAHWIWVHPGWVDGHSTK